MDTTNSGLPQFTPKVEVQIDWSRFIIKTVSNNEEREKALRLRHDVFLQELLGRTNTNLVDQDAFDDVCDHLVIIEKSTGRYVGTYRFISSAFSESFYTQTEFDLGNITSTEGDKLEMGRACIHPDFRSGFTFIALWKGLAGYISKHPVNQLFGCSSVMTTDVETTAQIIDFLKRHGHYSATYHCHPLAHYVLEGLDNALEIVEQQDPSERESLDADIKQRIPPLLWAYVDAGAKVVGQPAYDADFACMDFLTVLDTKNLRDDLVRKYKPW